MIRRFLTLLGRFGPYIVAFVVGIVLVISTFRSHFVTPAAPGSTEEVLFEVAKNANLQTVGDTLEAKGLVRHSYAVVWAGKAKGSDKLDFWPGEYRLSPGMTPSKILEVLLSHQIVQHPITVPEGVNIYDVTQIIMKSGLVSEEEVRRVMSDRSLMIKLDIPAMTPEGYIAPETYEFSRPINAEQILTRFVEGGKKRLDEKLRDWKERAKELGFTPYQVLVLASIVEKETAKPEERGTIASVFHNRLRIGMPLQSDPTVIYGLMPNFNGNLTKEDLKRPGPYNTYLNTGLPPTPICNPSPDSIHAVLYPAETDFLYFVGKGDGGHHFSKTYKEHQVAVANFQRGAGGGAPAGLP